MRTASIGAWAVVGLCLASCFKVEPRCPEVVAVDAGHVRVVIQQDSKHLLPRLPLAVCDSRGKNPLDAAHQYFDEGKFEEALSCASQAAALMSDEPLAHSERGAALSSLGRFEEAKLAYARALALEPDHLDSLLGAAHLYAVALPSNREHDELGVLYSERGVELSKEEKDTELLVRFAQLSAMGFNDLGMPTEALERAETVLATHPQHTEAAYEKAVALFELCRFPEAKVGFEKLLKDENQRAHAHHYMGRILEREGKFIQAESQYAQARHWAPEDFVETPVVSKKEFELEIQRALSKLPQDMQNDLKGVPVMAEEIPSLEDLMAVSPPLSPAIVGLFRGTPLTEKCEPEPGASENTPCRSIAMYRRNLLRIAKNREEFLEQIRVTLLHEIGHLRGEDDHELAARGLE